MNSLIVSNLSFISSSLRCRLLWVALVAVATAYSNAHAQFSAKEGKEYIADEFSDAPHRELHEEVRWLLNRGRFDSAQENKIRGTNFRDSWLQDTTGPLAPQGVIALAAKRHAEDLVAAKYFDFTILDPSNPRSPHRTQRGSTFFALGDGDFDRIEKTGKSSNYAPRATSEALAKSNQSLTEATDLYIEWWKSPTHRRALYRSVNREMGMGEASAHPNYLYVFDAAYTIIPGDIYEVYEKGDNFFTDSIFIDTNNNGAYSVGEGRGGVRVDLLVDGELHEWHDISSAVGSFAVPLAGIPFNQKVAVCLTNTGRTPLDLSVPVDAIALEKVSLAAGETRVWGLFVTDEDMSNFGFRNLELVPRLPETPPVVPEPIVEAPKAGAEKELAISIKTDPFYSYVVQYTDDMKNWQDHPKGVFIGNGGTITWTIEDIIGDESVPGRFYRIEIKPLAILELPAVRPVGVDLPIVNRLAR